MLIFPPWRLTKSLAIARDLVSHQGGNMSIDIDGDIFKVKVVMDEYPQQILHQK